VDKKTKMTRRLESKIGIANVNQREKFIEEQKQREKRETRNDDRIPERSRSFKRGKSGERRKPTNNKRKPQGGKKDNIKQCPAPKSQKVKSIYTLLGTTITQGKQGAQKRGTAATERLPKKGIRREWAKKT